VGTGSFGGGGSGALGRGGSGARFSVSSTSGANEDGTVKDFFGTRGRVAGPDIVSARALVRETFAQRRVGDYVVKMVSSEAVKGCFEELFIVGVLLTQQQNWATVAQQYGVKDRPGCLADLATAVKRKHLDASSMEAFREIASASVDDLLLASVGEDDDIYLDGKADDVFAAVRRSGAKIFASLAGHYFGSVLYRAMLRELPALEPREKNKILEAAQERADFIINKFKYTFAGKDQTTHRQLLKTFSEKPDWFQTKLRQDIES
jgi:hypothetical protein